MLIPSNVQQQEEEEERKWTTTGVINFPLPPPTTTFPGLRITNWYPPKWSVMCTGWRRVLYIESRKIERLSASMSKGNEINAIGNSLTGRIDLCEGFDSDKSTGYQLGTVEMLNNEIWEWGAQFISKVVNRTIVRFKGHRITCGTLAINMHP